MKLTPEGYESLVDFLKTEVIELTNIKDWIKGGPSISSSSSRDDRENEIAYFDNAYSIFETKCQLISDYCDHLKYHLDSMRPEDSEDE